MSAPAMTYATLLSDVEMYAERHDEEFINQIPRLVMLAEDTISKTVTGLGLIKVVRGQMQSGNPIYPKPNRWRESVSMNITFGVRRRVLKLRTYEFIRSCCPDESKQEAPRFYADYDDENFFIGPNPNRNYPFELLYYEKPEPLSMANQVNWTTRKAPSLLLFGTLMQAAPFLKNDQRAPVFQQMYLQAAEAVVAEAKRRAADRSALVRDD